MGIMWSFEAIYQWQFFWLLEQNLQITFPPCFDVDLVEEGGIGAQCGPEGGMLYDQSAGCRPCVPDTETPETKMLYDERIGNQLAKYQVRLMRLHAYASR